MVPIMDFVANIPLGDAQAHRQRTQYGHQMTDGHANLTYLARNGACMLHLLEAVVKRTKIVWVASLVVMIGLVTIFVITKQHSLSGQLQNCINRGGDCKLTVRSSGHLLTNEEQKAIFSTLFNNLHGSGVEVAGQYTRGTHKYVGLIFPDGERHRLFATCLVSNGDDDQFSLGDLIRTCLSAETFSKKLPHEYYFTRMSEVVERASQVGLTSLDDESFQPIAIENFVEGHRTVIELNKGNPSPKTYWEDKR